VAVQIIMSDECVERSLGETVGFALLFDEECVCGAVEYQGLNLPWRS
jgi:hypothetical protein